MSRGAPRPGSAAVASNGIAIAALKKKQLIVVTIVLTLLVGLVLVNFTGAERKVETDIPHLYPVDDPQFLRSMGLMMGPTIVDGNKAAELINGDRIFPSMLEAIRSARKTVLFETYIYWSGEIGHEFADALADRARNGVKVHVLLDWIGSSKAEASIIEKMKNAGVEVEKFHPLRWYNLQRMNNRTHRKLLIVDGAVGFTGGVGIAPEWTGNAQDPGHWRDSHFRVEGPVVAQMQSVMLDNWAKTTGHVLHGAQYFPPLKPVGTQSAQMFASSPNGGSESMLMMYLLAITAATRSIDLSSAYFVPDEISRNALVAAVKRGVKVRIITPGENMDAETVRRASRGLWGDLLRAGVEMYEYQPTMYHVKVMIVDGLMTSVGSTNFDVRSFRLNDEANLNIYDRAFAQRQTEVFEADLKKSRRITYESWKARPLSVKAHEHFLALFGPLL
jgi:cardiolipin synthase